MYKENGFAYRVLVLIIIIIIAIAGVLINKIAGENGVINKVAEVENEYIKEDILEKINYKITQKFIEINNEAKTNGTSVSEMYNSDVVIEFLKENSIIEEYYDENENLVEGIYNINIQMLEDTESENLNIEGNFRIEKQGETYFVVYYNNQGEHQEIGELQIQQTI